MLYAHTGHLNFYKKNSLTIQMDSRNIYVDAVKPPSLMLKRIFINVNIVKIMLILRLFQPVGVPNYLCKKWKQ